MNRTLQGRLVNELRVAGVRTLVRANAYLRDVYLTQHNARFRRAPRDSAVAFVPAGGVDLEAILCREDERRPPFAVRPCDRGNRARAAGRSS